MSRLLANVFRFFSYLVICLPPRIRYFLGDILGFIWLYVLRLRRDVLRENLKIAFPEKSEAERWRIAKASVFNMGRDIVEYCHLPFMDESYLDKEIFFHNEEIMHEALKTKRGVIMLTLHIGNGDYAVSGLSLRGFPMVLISKVFKIQWLNDLWFGMRGRLGTEFIPPRDSSYAILKALKKNKIVIFVNDQFMGPPIGAKTSFFGKETGSAMGIAVMAGRSRVPVIPTYTYRDENLKTHVVFMPEVPFEGDPKQDESLVKMVQKYNDVLESIIRKHPDQWMWIHRRWKKFREN